MKLDAVPSFISVLGLFDVEYRRLLKGGVPLDQDHSGLQRWQHLYHQEWAGLEQRDRTGDPTGGSRSIRRWD